MLIVYHRVCFIIIIIIIRLLSPDTLVSVIIFCKLFEWVREKFPITVLRKRDIIHEENSWMKLRMDFLKKFLNVVDVRSNAPQEQG